MWEDGPGGDEGRRRTWLVRTRVKLVASVETRSQMTMLGPLHPSPYEYPTRPQTDDWKSAALLLDVRKGESE